MLSLKAVAAGLFAMVLSAVVTSRANAANLTAFEFGGVFTRTTGTVHQVGDPFTSTVVFDANAADTDPSPSNGRYPYISWTVPYRDSTPIVLDPVSGNINVLAGDGGGSHTWLLRYTGATLLFELAVSFPPGTFLTDELPLTLDLSQAATTRFEALQPSLGVDLRGTITSFSVVPEPGMSAAFWVIGLLLGGRGRRIK